MFRLASLRLASARALAVAPRPAVAAARRTAMPAFAARWYSASGGLSRADIQSRIFQVLQDFDKVNQDKLSPAADFTKDLGLDSLDTVEVVMAIEEEFSVEIPDDEADNITTVKGAIDYISGRDDAH
ncbi:mitochondrial acyl carrier protein [Coemansia thaxteri]|nr:mitochondrial acyl carrier protein [Coemansia thaxteri]KAJ2470628.1 mitochondrial acyl carrier protein [Coemansia sp. RSA 2322]KAJ2471630.1 mitochondrial acyl carrier protein [Coemansia sp. RSA 2320]